MAFKVFNPLPAKYGWKWNVRKHELMSMFIQLEENPDLTAESDVNQSTILKYAKELGFNIKTRKNGDKCLVWILENSND